MRDVTALRVVELFDDYPSLGLSIVSSSTALGGNIAFNGGGIALNCGSITIIDEIAINVDVIKNRFKKMEQRSKTAERRLSQLLAAAAIFRRLGELARAEDEVKKLREGEQAEMQRDLVSAAILSKAVKNGEQQIHRRKARRSKGGERETAQVKTLARIERDVQKSSRIAVEELAQLVDYYRHKTDLKTSPNDALNKILANKQLTYRGRAMCLIQRYHSANVKLGAPFDNIDIHGKPRLVGWVPVKKAVLLKIFHETLPEAEQIVEEGAPLSLQQFMNYIATFRAAGTSAKSIEAKIRKSKIIIQAKDGAIEATGYVEHKGNAFVSLERYPQNVFFALNQEAIEFALKHSSRVYELQKKLSTNKPQGITDLSQCLNDKTPNKASITEQSLKSLDSFGLETPETQVLIEAWNLWRKELLIVVKE